MRRPCLQTAARDPANEVEPNQMHIKSKAVWSLETFVAFAPKAWWVSLWIWSFQNVCQAIEADFFGCCTQNNLWFIVGGQRVGYPVPWCTMRSDQAFIWMHLEHAERLVTRLVFSRFQVFLRGVMVTHGVCFWKAKRRIMPFRPKETFCFFSTKVICFHGFSYVNVYNGLWNVRSGWNWRIVTSAKVVLKNPSDEPADVRIVFQLDEPSKITGSWSGNSCGLTNSSTVVIWRQDSFPPGVMRKKLRPFNIQKVHLWIHSRSGDKCMIWWNALFAGVASVLRNISGKPSGVHLQLSFLDVLEVVVIEEGIEVGTDWLSQKHAKSSC